jgi:hypothetical protein
MISAPVWGLRPLRGCLVRTAKISEVYNFYWFAAFQRGFDNLENGLDNISGVMF